MTKAAITPVYVRLSQSQEYFGISRDTFERREKQGRIKIRRDGGMALLKTDEVIAMIEADAQAPKKVGAKVGASDDAKT